MVFTIHNLNYGQPKIADAAMHSQRFTTVSPTYALEVGGNPVIAPHVGKFMGIRYWCLELVMCIIDELRIW